MLSCSVSVVLGTVAISLECRGLTTVQSLDFDCVSCLSIYVCTTSYLLSSIPVQNPYLLSASYCGITVNTHIV